MNTNNQGVQITAIIGLVVIVLALIWAKIYAPTSGVNDLLSLIGGIVAVLLGLAKLQSVGNQIEDNAKATQRIEAKVEVVHGAVNGLNQAALANQAIVSRAEGKAEEKADVAAALLSSPLTPPAPDTPILTQEVLPGDPRYVGPPVEPAPTERYDPPPKRDNR